MNMGSPKAIGSCAQFLNAWCSAADEPGFFKKYEGRRIYKQSPKSWDACTAAADARADQITLHLFQPHQADQQRSFQQKNWTTDWSEQTSQDDLPARDTDGSIICGMGCGIQVLSHSILQMYAQSTLCNLSLHRNPPVYAHLNLSGSSMAPLVLQLRLWDEHLNKIPGVLLRQRLPPALAQLLQQRGIGRLQPHRIALRTSGVRSAADLCYGNMYCGLGRPLHYNKNVGWHTHISEGSTEPVGQQFQICKGQAWSSMRSNNACQPHTHTGSGVSGC